MPSKNTAVNKPGRQHTVKRSHESEKFDRYYSRIEKINKILDTDSNLDQVLMDKLQTAVDKLADEYGNDHKLGPDRYALLQAQSLLHYHRDELVQAQEFMEAAVQIKGSSYEFADEFLAGLQEKNMGKPRVIRGRINRSTYFLSNLFAGVMYGIIAAIIDANGKSSDPNYSLGGASLAIFIISVLLLIVYMVVLILKRMNDQNMSRWWIVVMFVPLFNIIPGLRLLFNAGSHGINRYGTEPRGTWRIWLLNNH